VSSTQTSSTRRSPWRGARRQSLVELHEVRHVARRAWPRMPGRGAVLVPPLPARAPSLRDAVVTRARDVRVLCSLRTLVHEEVPMMKIFKRCLVAVMRI